MTKEEKWNAYETMHRNIQSEYESISARMEELKGAGKEKSVTFRTLFGKKLVLKEMLAIYKVYGLEE